MITLLDIAGKKYAVLGLGKSGMATAATLRASRADFIVWDDNEKNRAAATFAGYKLVDPTTIDPSVYSGLVISADIQQLPTPHAVVTHFRNAGVPVISDIELLFKASPITTYVGIAGSKNTAETTALVAHILKHSYRKVQVAAGADAAVLGFQPMGADAYCVLELCHAQLALLKNNRIRVAVLLNILTDQMPNTDNVENYVATHKRIISDGAPQTLVIGVDEPETRAIVGEVKGWRHLQIEEVSIDHPVRSGIELRDSVMVAHRLTGTKDIVDLAKLPHLSDKKDWQSACAAFAVCRALGLSFELIEHGLHTFPGTLAAMSKI